MEEISNNISMYSSYIIIALVAMNFLLLVISVINSIRIYKQRKRYCKLTSDIKDKDLEKIIIEYYDKVKKVVQKNEDMEQQIKMVEGKLQLCAQKIGVIRYNAFENVGSNLSFAIAVLDSNDSGFIINGVYSRESSTTYAKPIVEGKTKYTLSAEEIQALDLARKNHNERTFAIS
ncbi:MAG: DUF4446 family protein [Clostridia bacterium]